MSSLFEEDGSPLHKLATQRHQALELQQALVQMKQGGPSTETMGFRAGQVGTWEWDRKTNRVRWSSETEQIFDLSPGTFDGSYEGFFALVHPDDRHPLSDAIAKAVEDHAPLRIEHRIITPSGMTRWVACRGRATRGGNEPISDMMGTVEDITARKEFELTQHAVRETLEALVQERTAGLEQAILDLKDHLEQKQQIESSLKSSEQRYQLLYEHNPSMYFTLLPDGTVISVNHFGAGQLGYEKEDLIGHSILTLFEGKDHQAILEQLHACAARPYTPFQWDVQKIRKDGTKLWVKERARAVHDQAKQLVVLVSCEDITEHRNAEEQLREKEARWRAFYEQAGVGIAQLDVSGRFIRINPQLCETLGYSPDTMLQGTFQEFTHPDDLSANMSCLDELLTNTQPSCSVEQRFRRSDNTWLWVEVTVSLVRATSGAPAYFIAVIQNINERKQAEQQLRDSEQAIRSLLEATSHPGLTLDERIQTVLELGCRRFSLPIGLVTDADGDQLKLRHVWAPSTTLAPGIHFPIAETYCGETLKSKSLIAIEQASTSKWSKHPGHEKFGFQCYIGAPLMDRGQLHGTICFAGPEPYSRCFSQADKDFLQLMARWVSGELSRHDSEQAVKEQEALLRSVIETATDAIFMKDREGRYRFVNSASARNIGKTQAEIIGKKDDELFPQERATRLMTVDQEVFVESAPRNFEELVKLNGTPRTFATIKTPHRDQSGRVVGLVGVARDITAVKQTEEALRISEERFKIAFRASPHPVIITELASGRCLEVNDASLKLFGYERDEVIGRTTIMLGIWPTLEDRGRFFQQLREEGAVHNREISLRTKDRKVRELLVSSEIIELNGTTCLITVGNDVTEHKQAEAALRESEERFAKAFRSSPYPIVLSELESGLCLDANDAAIHLFGYHREEVAGKTAEQLGLWPTPDHRHRFVTKLKQTGSVRNVETSLRMKSGEYRTCLISAEHIELSGKHCMVTIGLDVTDQRRAEQALRLAQTAVDRSADLIFWIDQSAKFLYVNDAACQRLGYTRDELHGMTVADIDPECQWDRWPAHWEDLRQKGMIRFERRHQGKSGETYPVEVVANFVVVDGREYYFSFVRDISDRKRSYSLLQAAMNSVTDGLLIVDRQGTITSTNQRFLHLWSIPQTLTDSGDDGALLNFVVDQLTEPETFLRKVHELYAHPDQESFDVLSFKDGRVFERYSRPQVLDGTIVGRVWSFRDVTKQTRAEEALRLSEFRLQRFVADAPVGLCILDDNWRAISANKALCELTGYEEREIIGSTYALYTHPDDLAANITLTDEFFRGIRSEYTYEKRYIRKSGEIIWVSVKATRVELSGHKGPLLLAAVQDITERKLALEEREQLSRDLHDNLLQALYAVGMQLEASKLTMGQSLRRSKAHISQAINQLNSLMLDVRQFIAVLTQHTPREFDFGQALQQLTSSVAGTEHTVPELNITPPVLSFITPPMGEQLLNIAREALSNSLRHASASRRWIELGLVNNSICLLIGDNGIGFSTKKRPRKGHGLVNMAARTRQILGTFVLDSAPGRGTTIRVTIPLKKGPVYE